MRIYLSARFGRAAELREYREELTAMGNTVEATWLDEPVGNDGTDDHAELIRFATNDLADMRRCRVLVAFTEQPGSPWARGGRHVEFGVMLERSHMAGFLDGKPLFLYVVGPVENVFHSLPCVKRFETWAEFVEHFKTVR